jgi:intron-binding protein aquarius
VGYLRDLRRLTVALSRARLGLYVLGRRQVFEDCVELRDAFALLFQRPDKLVLVTGEMWPSQRRIPVQGADEADTVPSEVVMEGVEHLGQYVHEMTQTRAGQLRSEMGLPPNDLLSKSMADQPYKDDGPSIEEDAEEDEVIDEPAVEEGFGTEVK